jgi:hypothetical protein
MVHSAHLHHSVSRSSIVIGHAEHRPVEIIVVVLFRLSFLPYFLVIPFEFKSLIAAHRLSYGCDTKILLN